MQHQTSTPLRRISITGMWTVAAMLLFVPAASAYIDPVTTGTLFTAIIAGAAAAGTAYLTYLSRIKQFFRDKFGTNDDDPETVEAEPAVTKSD